MTYVLLKPERLDEHWYTIPHRIIFSSFQFLGGCSLTWDKWIHRFQNGFFDKKWSLLIMKCPIVCRQFFSQVNFLAGVYIYLKNFFFFFFFYKHMSIYSRIQVNTRGWSGGVKVSCILCHRGVHLILAYSWARPAIVEVGKGRGGMFLFLLFLPFHSCSSFFPVPLFHLFYYLFYLFSPFLWETTQNDPQGLTCR